MKPVFEKIRPLAFWIIDSLKRGTIRAHFDDTEFIMKDYSSKAVSERLNNRMESILKHAVNTTGFYKNFKDYNSLTDFPVINKNIIKERINDFISNQYDLKDLIPERTSGTTGTPLTVFHDRHKRLRHNAETIFFNKSAGYDLGMRLYFIRIWDDRFKKSALKAWMQNLVPVNIVNLGEERIASLVRRITDDNSTIVLMGYTSSLKEVCRYMESNNIPPVRSEVRSIIAIAEPLDENTASSLKKFFNAQVFSRYANAENGIIAQQIIGGEKELYINSSSFYVEILNTDNDSPVQDGTPGRIVVTDFFNYGMPLIRYDTGDIGIISNITRNNLTCRTLTKIEGRLTDRIYDTSANYLDPMMLMANMSQYQDIKQYQIIQLDKTRYQLVLNSVNPYPRIREIESFYHNCFGENSVIEIKYVDEIPVLSSGKRKAVYNRYMNQEKSV